MLARSVLRITKQVAAPTRAVKLAPVAVRFMGGHSAAPSGDVVIPELHDTLEWVLSSPPNVHQFEEPPIIVEIEHVKAVPTPDVH